jgi:pyruvate/2-oxoglutarate dehydrogenase complex dihydrolipoamide dehydrogenase (E3) component
VHDPDGQDSELHAEHLLVAAGYRAVTEGLDLDRVGSSSSPASWSITTTRGLVKLAADADNERVLGVHAVSAAGELAAAVYLLAAGMAATQVAKLCCPYLTATEALKLTAQTFTRDVTYLSCCARQTLTWSLRWTRHRCTHRSLRSG